MTNPTGSQLQHLFQWCLWQKKKLGHISAAALCVRPQLWQLLSIAKKLLFLAALKAGAVYGLDIPSLCTLRLVMKAEDSRWSLLGAAWKISGLLLSSSAMGPVEPVITLPISTASGSRRLTSPSKASHRQTHSRQDSSEATSADVKSVWKIYRSLS